MTTRAVARLWLSHQKSFASVASNQPVNDALQKGYRQQQVGNSPCISEESTVQEAARRFMSDGVGSLIAMNSIGRVSGVISERDIIRKVALLDRDPAKVKVKDIYTPPPHLILATARNTVEECMQRIDEYDVYSLPILDDAADLVGMVSIENCLRAVLEDQVTTDRLVSRDATSAVNESAAEMMEIAAVEDCLRAILEDESSTSGGNPMKLRAATTNEDTEPMAHAD